MTEIWFPKIDTIKGDNAVKNAWDEFRKKIKKKRNIRIEPQGCNKKSFVVPVELIVVIQQRNYWLKAIVLEELNFRECGYIDCVRKGIPEYDGENEIRICYWIYDKTKNQWIFRKEPIMMPVSDFVRLKTIYQSIKMGVTEIAEQLGLEKNLM